MLNTESVNPPNSSLTELLNLYNSGNLVGSESLCRNLLEKFPDSPIVWNVLGVVLQGQGKADDALAAYEDSIRKSPEYAEAYHNSGILLNALGRPEEAVEKFKKVIELNPEDSDTRNNIGVLLQGLNKNEEAAPV